MFLYFPFLFSSSVLRSFFSFPASSLFGTQQQLTHPPVKSSTLPLRKMPVSQGVAPWHTIFNSSCVIPLWESATAHPYYSLNPYMHLYYFILSVVERPPLLQRSLAREFGRVRNFFSF